MVQAHPIRPIQITLNDAPMIQHFIPTMIHAEKFQQSLEIIRDPQI